MSDVFDRMLAPGSPNGLFYGVFAGIVTNAKDPAGLGRVKVKLPWMADDVESTWARIAAPMAGPGSGISFPPAVDDEVLVAFEHGSPEHPFVLGALWNGKDKPPAPNAEGKSDVHVIRTRSGHVIRLTDTDGAEQIEIVDRTGHNSMVISSADGTVTVTAAKDVTIRADGPLRLSGTDVAITATAALTLKAGTTLTAEGQLVSIN